MSKVAHGGVHVSQTSADMRLFSENLYVVTSRSWYNFVETRHIGWTNGKLCSKLHIIMDSCVKICVQTHLFLTANMSHSAFTESKTMETSWSVTRLNRCGQSLCQSFFMVSRSSWPLLSVFFVISRSSWSVALRGQSALFLVVVVSLLNTPRVLQS